MGGLGRRGVRAGGSPHVAIRRTMMRRGDDPKPGVPSAEFDAIVSRSAGRRGTFAELSREAQAAPVQSRGAGLSPSLVVRVEESWTDAAVSGPPQDPR